jgi:outer membrane protein OmpA-like peptidoglycan-associated protein
MEVFPMHRLPIALLLALAATSMPPAVAAQESCKGLRYGEGERAVCLTQGESSFADAVVSFKPGKRAAAGTAAKPAHTLGKPDYTMPSAPGFLALGCDGELVVRFDDNALVQSAGPDLYIFEVGPDVEATEVAVSIDGGTWIEVGRVEGARSDLELKGLIEDDQSYRFVRLRNAGTDCAGRYPGADIDAVAAVGSALRLSLDSAVLFDVGSAELKPAARDELLKVAGLIKARNGKGAIRIEGHTDGDGDAAMNLALSQRRAQSVLEFMAAEAGLDRQRMQSIGAGESRPVAANDSVANKARNRRVEIIVR